MTDMPLPDGVTPQQAATAAREFSGVVFDLVTLWQTGDQAGANARIHELDHQQLKAVAGGLLGMAASALTAMADLAEVEPRQVLAMIAGETLLMANDLEKRQ